MSKQLPSSDLTRHLQWDGRELPLLKKPYVRPYLTVEQIYERGSIRRSNFHIEMYRAILEEIYPNGIIASIPEIMAMNATHGDNPTLPLRFTTSTEEIIGIDTKGIYTEKGKPVVAVFHGAGLITPDMPQIDNVAAFTQKEFDELLEDGHVQTKGKIPTVSLAEVLESGIHGWPRCGVVIPYDRHEIGSSCYMRCSTFMKNPLAIARSGGKMFMQEYYEAYKAAMHTKRIYHENKFDSTDFTDSPKGFIISSHAGFRVVNFNKGNITHTYWVVPGVPND